MAAVRGSLAERGRFNTKADGIAFWKSVGWTPRNDIGVISKTLEPNRRQRFDSSTKGQDMAKGKHWETGATKTHGSQCRTRL